MYIPLSRTLDQDFKIVHLAYSAHEQAQLRAAGIDDVINFKERVAASLARGSALDYALLERIDALFIAETDGRFTLNGSIQSDRGFALLEREEALLMCQVYYDVWRAILDEHDVRYVMHEPVSLLMNHMCSVLCAQRGALYLYQIMTVSPGGELSYLNVTGDNFGCPELSDGYARCMADPALIDRARCEAFLAKFRSSFGIYLGGQIKTSTSFVNLMLRSLRRRARRLLHSGKLDRLADNIDYWELQQDVPRERIANLRQYRKQIVYDQFDPDCNYYYYSLHLEPEAVVLYLADGLYTNQTKLIENIAAQLPVDSVLYVKDHPHDNGYRSVADYVRLKAIPNVKLLAPTLPGKLVMKDAVGVFTINGTAGFEALLLGKQVYTFGRTFYGACARVNYIHDIRALRALLYARRGLRYQDDMVLMAFVMAYIDALHVGMVDYFVGRAASYGLDLDQNIATIGRDFVAFAKTY
jgi:hypothetical protein